MLYESLEELCKVISELPPEKICQLLLTFQCCNWSDDIHSDLEEALKEVTQ